MGWGIQSTGLLFWTLGFYICLRLVIFSRSSQLLHLFPHAYNNVSNTIECSIRELATYSFETAENIASPELFKYKTISTQGFFGEAADFEFLYPQEYSVVVCLHTCTCCYSFVVCFSRSTENLFLNKEEQRQRLIKLKIKCR